MLYVVQLSGARGLIKWSQSELANAAGVGLSTIKRMESGGELVRGISNNVWKVQRALEAAGIEFIDENGGGPGVRLKSRMGNSLFG